MNRYERTLNFALAILLITCFTGCKATRFAHSGLGERLTSDNVLQSAGAPLSAKVIRDSLPNGGMRGRNVEFTRDFEVTLACDTFGEFVGRYYDEMLRQVLARGATIHYNAQVVPGDGQFRDFAYRYHWANNEGLIRLYSAPTTTNQLRVILYCYEHHD